MLDTIVKSLSSLQLSELKRFGDKVNKFGVSFAVCDVSGELVLLCGNRKFNSNSKQLIKAGLRALNQNGQDSHIETSGNVRRFGERNQILAVALKSGSEAVGAALIDLGDNLLCVECDAYRDTQYDIRNTILSEMLVLLAENFESVSKAQQQIEMVGTELAHVYEELVLLHKLSTNLKVTATEAKFLQMACDNLSDIVSVEGIAILIEKNANDEKQLVLAAGSGLIDINEQMAAILQNRLAEEITNGKEALLDSEVDSPFKYDWPRNTKNIIAVPLFGKDGSQLHFAERGQNGTYTIGLMVAINRVDKQDFDTTDVKLFNSVANSCAVFIENGRLFKDLKELFIGSLKALTSSIDAKDKYTRGHSERVAFISRWIAERIAEDETLEEEQIHKIYLTGLLHDIGKIGIKETALNKDGLLTEQERDCIRKHPSIGAGILRAINQMRDIVPGVLCHHERVDGKGYPNGLVDEQIPLAGKIVGLADSFDAMTSKRTYRDAKTVEQALAEIEKGLGTQFDKKVGRVFLDSDVYQLWDILQGGFNQIYGDSSFAEYGTVAVGTLIK